MKKILGIFALALLLILPISANAQVSISGQQVSKNAEGVFTAELYITVTEGDQIPEQSITLTGNNAIIKSINVEGEWEKDETRSTLAEDGLKADLVLRYTGKDGMYYGDGTKVKVATITYVHDTTAAESADCYISLSIPNGTSYDIKTTTPANTGSFLPVIGIASGVVLLGAIYIVSRKSSKLYRM